MTSMFLDYALRALDGAQQVLRPDFYPIHYDHKARRVNVRYMGRGSAPTGDIGRVCRETERAAEAVSEALQADPTLHLVEDHKGRWVIIRLA